MSNYGYPKNVLNWEPQAYLGEVRPGNSRVLYFTVSADPTTTQTNTGLLLVFPWLRGETIQPILFSKSAVEE